MSYARSLLSRGEEVVFETRQHWFAVVGRTWGYILVAVLALAVTIWAATQESSTPVMLLEVAGLLALIGSLVRIGLVVWSWRNQEYLITTRRVIKCEGILNKTMGDSGLEKVNDAHLTQSWLGRIFGFGHLDIMTASDEPGAIEDFEMMADAVEFKIAMLNQKQALSDPDLARPPTQRLAPMPALQRADAMPPRAGSERVQAVASAPPRSAAPDAGTPALGLPTPPPEAGGHATPLAADELATTLERLAGLRDRGLITPDEYEAKKTELLERM
jgi:membrane protein YdbS with pleckstrin-like domain